MVRSKISSGFSKNTEFMGVDLEVFVKLFEFSVPILSTNLIPRF